MLSVYQAFDVLAILRQGVKFYFLYNYEIFCMLQ